MAKYDVKHACGHIVTHNLIGPRRSREWRIQKLEEELCPECWQAELRRRNAEAAEANKAMDLPPLVGTERQIAWAESIRLRQIKAVEELLAGSEKYHDDELLNHPRLPDAVEMLHAQTSAAWWIDTRTFGPYTLLQEMLRIALRSSPPPEETVAEVEARAEATVRPENQKTDTVAEIRITGDTIEILFPERRDDFRELVRYKLGYTWNGSCWQRKIGQFNGTVADRAAEAGHRLLASGFPIRIYDAEIRARAVGGEYAPEPKRWVRKAVQGPYAGWFVIVWPRGDDFYAAARRIPGSRYHNGAMYVPAEQFEQVLDFAEVHGFHVSAGAMELAQQSREIKESALVAKVEPPKTTRRAAGDTAPPKLDVPDEVDVDDELRDD